MAFLNCCQSFKKTKSPIDKDKMQTMYHWIDKSFAPLLVNGELMDMSRGRSISRANRKGARGRSRSTKRDSPDSGYV